MSEVSCAAAVLKIELLQTKIMHMWLMVFTVKPYTIPGEVTSCTETLKAVWCSSSKDRVHMDKQTSRRTDGK